MINRDTEKDASIGFVSLGCPKATVDSELIVTELQRSGYQVGASDEASDVVVINTCGFIDAARDESLEAIEEVVARGQQVIVTGCLGAERELLKTKFPSLEFISGPADVGPVTDAVKKLLPQSHNDHHDLQRVRLTPNHYAYLKISEGCNHTCSFCIIPSMRGKLRSRSVADIVAEAEQARDAGVKELLMVAQDLSAYGVDSKYQSLDSQGEAITADLYQLLLQLEGLVPWLRLHYVYPYPNVDRIVELIARGVALPYLDIPLQHAEPRILKAMRRPAAAEKTLERIQKWRALCPDLAIRSTFIVGFPGETDEDVGVLLDFLEAAELDRVGVFTYSPVQGASANELADHVDERDKMDRQERVYEVQAEISRSRLERHIGKRLTVLVEEDGTVARSAYDAPEIDGQVLLDTPCDVGEFVVAEITATDGHDLDGTVIGSQVTVR